MPRKKISTEAEIIDAIPELDENESIVIEDTKRIRRERNQPSRESGEAIDIAEVAALTDETSENQSFGDNSLAALIFDDGGEDLENQFCTIHVRRRPDSMRDRFATPCTSVLNYPPLTNVEITADRSEIEETVRNTYGGGHYFFQIRFNNRLAKSWQSSLADSPQGAKNETETAPAPLPPQPPVNPFDQFFEAMEKQKQLRDFLFGDEQKRFEKEIEQLRDELREARDQRPPPATQSDLALLLSAMKETNSPHLIDFAREYLSPDNKEESFGVWDFAKYVFDNKEQLAPIVGSLFGGAMPMPAGMPNVQDVLRKQPPAGMPPASPPISNFRRRVAPPPDPVEETEKAIDAEPTFDNEVDSQGEGTEVENGD